MLRGRMHQAPIISTVGSQQAPALGGGPSAGALQHVHPSRVVGPECVVECESAPCATLELSLVPEV